MDIKKRYYNLQKASQTYLGWQWLLPLRDADAYHLKSLRIPDTDEQWDFDGLLLSLVKILINSLNEESLKKLIPYEKQEALKDKSGIALLEAVLYLNGLEGADAHIVFLRKLDSICLSGSARRKRKNYLKIANHFGVEDQNPQHVFAHILNSASEVLDYFIILVSSGQIREKFERNQIAIGYALFSDIIGIADFGATNASVNHDDVIYELETKL